VLPADFLIEHADLIATCAGPAPRRGLAQREISPIHNGVVAAFEGRITYVGDAGGLDGVVDAQKSATRIDARGCSVVPGFIDAHTHVVYAGDRRSELQRRLAGETYASIAANGGGIVRTVEATRAASADDLVASAKTRLDEMLACGTTFCEVKSGYGLEVESELRQLRAIRTLDQEHAIDVVPTFMGAHDIPVEYRGRRSEYVGLVIEEMLPRVAEEGLAEYCDVFCEQGVFTPEESIAVLEAGRAAGLTAPRRPSRR
jgi:imidazolonepropionase